MKPPVCLSVPSLGWGEPPPAAAPWPQQPEEGLAAAVCRGPMCRGRVVLRGDGGVLPPRSGRRRKRCGIP